MKTIILTLLAVLSTFILIAQAPQAFKYQAVARNSSGEVLSNQDVSFQISILQGSTSGTAVYVETHDTITNEFGLVNLEIGNGTLVNGDFTTIDWGSDIYFMQIEMDEAGGVNYQLLGTSQLLSVPYALHSNDVTNDKDEQTFSVSGDTLFISNGNYVILPGVSPTIPFISCGDILTDIDGSTYNTVLIGEQCWMKENLKTTTYSNGTPIPNVIDGNEWLNLTTGAYVWYANDISWKDLYGALYNWYATIDPNGLCPTGWHVPTHNEWTALTDIIGGTGYSHGDELKSCRQVNSPLGGGCNTSEHPRWNEHGFFYGTDDYGFSGLPGGHRHSSAGFSQLGSFGYWWSSTEDTSDWAWLRWLDSSDGTVAVTTFPKLLGFSIRCIKD